MASCTYTRLLTKSVMASCDQYTIDTVGIPSSTLMERAAHGVVAYMTAHQDVFPLGNSHILVLCGSGNNGGDGFAVARFLAGDGWRVSVCYTGRLQADGSPDGAHMSQECGQQYLKLKDTLIPIFAPCHMADVLPTVDLVVDAMVGIGLDRDIAGDLAHLIQAVNALHRPVLAVDIPSGVCADTGNILGCAIHATATVTMQALKRGMLLYPAADLCGDIYICDIGVDLSPAKDEHFFLADKTLLNSVLIPRSRRSHKGTYGRLGLVGGSEDMCGAVILAGMGAMRSGVGLVHVFTPTPNKTPLHVTLPEAILSCYNTNAPLNGQIIKDVATCDGVVVGCGLGTSAFAYHLLSALLEHLPIDEHFPIVLDADALNLLAKHPDLWGTRLLRKGCRQVVITPHPAEFARLVDVPVTDILANPLFYAQGFAKDHGVVVVLKDAHTVIASPDGQVFICPYGNAGMAKGGSGDVLAGIMGSILVQHRHDIQDHLSMGELASVSVALHGLSGDVAAEIHGEFAMTPSDLANAIGEVTREFSDTRTAITHA